uniref:Uncharacterized protein n=1 Tax=Fusarium oxysporum (strain Fo5176) TaxID=660025 RepID=A0A0D2Y3N1_FUSOF
MRFGIGQYIHQRHMFAPYNESQTEDIPSKRESESWGEGSTKKLKTERHQSIPAATTFNDQEKDGTKEKKHDYMTHHIAAHLQTLMFLTLRVISMQQGVGSEEEDAAESNAGVLESVRHRNPPRSSYYSGSRSVSQWQCSLYYQSDYGDIIQLYKYKSRHGKEN